MPAPTDRPHRLAGLLTPRVLGLIALNAVAAGVVAYLAVRVPLVAPLSGGDSLVFSPGTPPPVPRTEAARYWGAAVAALLMVVVVDTFVIARTMRRRRKAVLSEAAGTVGGVSAPGPLSLERVPLPVVAIAAGISGILIVATLLQAYPPWAVVMAGLVPFLPLYWQEAAWKYERYGLWAIFGTIVLLQIGHMVEHGVQVGQLLVSDGRLARSHGVFGQLDFELVHFIWDTAIWLSLCFLLYRFSGVSRWLVVAFAAASLHEVEHVYLFWLYVSHYGFYMQGGFEGILGYGGVIGSPLARPYLHFAYNFLVVVPMTLAFWDYTKGRSERLSGRP